MQKKAADICTFVFDICINSATNCKKIHGMTIFVIYINQTNVKTAFSYIAGWLQGQVEWLLEMCLDHACQVSTMWQPCQKQIYFC